jgi:hypothetical protein
MVWGVMEAEVVWAGGIFVGVKDGRSSDLFCSGKG